MSQWIWSLYVFAMVAGMALPLQAGINSQLTRYLGHPLHSSLVSFIIGSGGLAAYVWLSGLPSPQMKAVPMSEPWLWVGGLLGAFYVAATIILAPKLGAATMISLIVVGQLTASVALDHWGLAGFPVHAASWPRIGGLALILAGVLLVTSN